MALDLKPFLEPLRSWCVRWGVRELSVFGSALRADFGPDSDVDLLIELDPGRTVDEEDAERMLAEAAAILGRPVDLVEKRLLRNPFIRYEVLSRRRVVYAA